MCIRDRNHGWKIVGESASEEEIETAVLVAAGGIYVSGGVPGVNRGRGKGGWSVAEILLNFGKGAAGVDAAYTDFLNRISHAVADVVCSMPVSYTHLPEDAEDFFNSNGMSGRENTAAPPIHKKGYCGFNHLKAATIPRNTVIDAFGRVNVVCEPAATTVATGG